MKTEDIIFKVLVGSHAYGTNVEGSDEDIKGVYIQSPEDVLENGYREQYSVSKDETYYEIRRFVELCCTGNPTMLEVLYSPENCILFKDPIFDVLLKERDKFLSKSCKWSFGGYAYSQIEKAKGLNKKMNWEKSKIERKNILDFCYIYNEKYKVVKLKDWLKSNNYRQEHCGLTSLPHFRSMFNLYYDCVRDTMMDNPRMEKLPTFEFKGIVQDPETSNDISLSEVPEYYRDMVEALLFFNKDEYSVHCKDYRSYQDWLKNRNTQRYVDVKDHGQQIDGKNLLHCYRLIETAIEIAQQKTINVRRPNAAFLIEIRKGKHDLNKLLDKAAGMIENLNKEFDKSDLPEKVDRGHFLSLVVKLRKQFYEKTKI